jgi:hypothetical protein
MRILQPNQTRPAPRHSISRPLEPGRRGPAKHGYVRADMLLPIMLRELLLLSGRGGGL